VDRWAQHGPGRRRHRAGGGRPRSVLARDGRGPRLAAGQHRRARERGDRRGHPRVPSPAPDRVAAEPDRPHHERVAGDRVVRRLGAAVRRPRHDAVRAAGRLGGRAPRWPAGPDLPDRVLPARTRRHLPVAQVALGGGCGVGRLRGVHGGSRSRGPGPDQPQRRPHRHRADRPGPAQRRSHPDHADAARERGEPGDPAPALVRSGAPAGPDRDHRRCVGGSRAGLADRGPELRGRKAAVVGERSAVRVVRAAGRVSRRRRPALPAVGRRVHHQQSPGARDRHGSRRGGLCRPGRDVRWDGRRPG
jgi:hypothetical protein